MMKLSIVLSLIGCVTAYEWSTDSSCAWPPDGGIIWQQKRFDVAAEPYGESECMTACINTATAAVEDSIGFSDYTYNPDGGIGYFYDGNTATFTTAAEGSSWCCRWGSVQGSCQVRYHATTITPSFVSLTAYKAFTFPSASLLPAASSTGVGGDPHMLFPHGGKADYKGKNNTYYNFISAKFFSLNLLTLFAYFDLHDKNHPMHKRVNGSFTTEAHAVLQTNTSKMVRVSLVADTISKDGNMVFVNGSIDDVPFKMGPNREKVIDNVKLTTGYSSLHVLNPEFDVTITPLNLLSSSREGMWSNQSWGRSLERNVTGTHHRLDLQVKLRVPEDQLKLPPHGILGQHWDGDGKAIDGEEDVFPYKGDFTTYAMAKGALEGEPTDYEMAGKYATAFKFSRFDATSAKPRDVAKLVAAGVLNAPRGAAVEEEGDFVGATERKMVLMAQREL